VTLLYALVDCRIDTLGMTAIFVARKHDAHIFGVEIIAEYAGWLSASKLCWRYKIRDCGRSRTSEMAEPDSFIHNLASLSNTVTH
jgi:hypothetical protein